MEDAKSHALQQVKANHGDIHLEWLLQRQPNPWCWRHDVHLLVSPHVEPRQLAFSNRIGRRSSYSQVDADWCTEPPLDSTSCSHFAGVVNTPSAKPQLTPGFQGSRVPLHSQQNEEWNQSDRLHLRPLNPCQPWRIPCNNAAAMLRLVPPCLYAFSHDETRWNEPLQPQRAGIHVAWIDWLPYFPGIKLSQIPDPGLAVPSVARRIGSHEAWAEEKRHGRIHQAPIAVASSLLNVSCCLPCDLSYLRTAKCCLYCISVARKSLPRLSIWNGKCTIPQG